MTHETIDEIANRLGTDKGSRINDYCNFYEQQFGYLRDDAIKILEIGVFKGHSISMWEQAFPRAEITGIDRDLGQLERSPQRAKLFSADASDRKALRQICEERGPFDIIVEDSAHTIDVTHAAFEALFIDHVSPGGWFVVEDTAAHWKCYPGRNAFSEWAVDLAGRMTHLDYRMKTTRRDTWDNPSPYQLAVDYAIMRAGIVAFRMVP